MPFTAFQTITAAALNRIQPVTYKADGTNLALSTTETDLPSATITLSTSAANAIYVAEAQFDFYVPTTGAATVTGRLAVDGVTQSKGADFTPQTNGDRVPGFQVWRGTLASSGSHTLKLRGLKSGAVGTMQIFTSTLLVTIYEVV